MEWAEEKKRIHKENHAKWALDRYMNARTTLQPSLGLMCAGPASVNNIDGEWEAIYKSNMKSIKDYDESTNLLPNPYSRFTRSDKTRSIEITEDPNGSHLNNQPQKVNINIDNQIIKYMVDNGLHSVDGVSLPSKYVKRLELISPLVKKDITIYWREICDSNPRIHRFSFSNSKLNYVLMCQDTYYGSTISGEYNTMKIPKKILALFLSEQISWDEISYSRYYSIKQSQNGFLPLFIQALRCIHNEELYNSFITDKCKIYVNNTMQVCFKSFTGKPVIKDIKRHCPHQNFDLKDTNSIEKNILTCPMHGHKFNLDTGLCIFGDKSNNILADG